MADSALGQHPAQYQPGGTPLAESVATEAAEAADRQGEVGLTGGLELLEAFGRAGRPGRALRTPRGPTTEKGVIRRSPLTRTLGADPTLMCRSDAPCSTTWRKTAGRSITTNVYRQVLVSA